MSFCLRSVLAGLLVFAAPAAWAAQSCTTNGDCFDGNDCTVDACVSSACVRTPDANACGGGVVEALLPAKKVKLRIPPSAPERNGVRMLVTGGAFTKDNMPAPLSADDPVVVGGSMRIFTNAGDGFDHTYPLPAEHWNYFPFFNPTDYRGYQYKDAFNEASPIGVVKIIADKTMKSKGKDDMDFTLATNPDPLHVVLTMGRHRYCFAMGGERYNFKEDKIFWSKLAPAPAACPCNADTDCDDGLACSGTETCVAGYCQAGGGVCASPSGAFVDLAR